MKRNKGITLIALVVTIIVLLILAGISIAMLTGTNGILTRANEARTENTKAAEREQISLAYATEKSILIEQESAEPVTSVALENRLKEDGAKIRSVEEEEDRLLVTFDTGNLYYVDEEGNITDGTPPEPPAPPIIGELEKPTEETGVQFDKLYGVIEIAWLDRNNNVLSNPMRISRTDLGGMTPVKWEGTPGSYVEKTTTISDSSWYEYVAQTGKTETAGTSRWANAKAVNGENEAYFVWIPRYSYKIIYFKDATSRDNYIADNTSSAGIIGYSTRYGMVNVIDGTPKLVTDSEPSNINQSVQTEGYRDYIPHPGFEFDGAKKGIWVGKYESSGTLEAITIKPNVSSLNTKTMHNFFPASLKVKDMYQLSGTMESHLMKNVEWGASAYLAASKYGRNGTEITINNSSTFISGNAADTVSGDSAEGTTNAYDTPGGVLASTTANIYGIYDMSGGEYEYVAAYVNNSYLQTGTYYRELKEAVAENPKYADVYDVHYYNDNQLNNYRTNSRRYGDALFETSNTSPGMNAWNLDESMFPFSTLHGFIRGGYFAGRTNSGAFHFAGASGNYGKNISIRIALTN